MPRRTGVLRVAGLAAAVRGKVDLIRAARPNARDIQGGRRACIQCGGTNGSSGRPSAKWLSMSKDELIVQLVKVALGILIGGYFLWWSLEVLKRLPPPH